MSDLRQAFSRVKLKGKLLENNLEQNVSKKTQKPYIAGSLVLETSPDNTVKVEMYANKFKKDGNKSKLFSNFMTIMNNYKSVADVGREGADDVEFNSAELSPNAFQSNDGEIVEYVKIRGVFPNRIKGDYEPKATFEVEVVVDGIFDEMDNEGESPTGAKIIKGYLVGYGGSVSAVEFVVESDQGISFIESQYSKGDTVKLFGNLINEEIKTKRVEEMGFGEDIVSEKTTTKRKFLVTRGSAPLTGNKAYAVEEVEEAIKIRNINLKSESSNKSSSNTKKDSGGGKSSNSFDPANF